jgi:hypothetical protein
LGNLFDGKQEPALILVDTTNGQPIIPKYAIRKVQSTLLDRIHHLQHLTLLRSSADKPTLSRLRSTAGTGNGSCWFQPSNDPHLRFSDWDFTFAARYRLGLPFTQQQLVCQHVSSHQPEAEPCSKPLDANMYHALTCKHGGGVTRVHNSIVNALAHWCNQAGHDPKLEFAAPEFARLSPFARNATLSCTQTSTLSQTLIHTQNENTLADASDPDRFNPHHELPPSGHETSQIQDGVIDIVPIRPPFGR